jgi:hypothetical protein
MPNAGDSGVTYCDCGKNRATLLPRLGAAAHKDCARRITVQEKGPESYVTT